MTNGGTHGKLLVVSPPVYSRFLQGKLPALHIIIFYNNIALRCSFAFGFRSNKLVITKKKAKKKKLIAGKTPYAMTKISATLLMMGLAREEASCMHATSLWPATGVNITNSL